MGSNLYLAKEISFKLGIYDFARKAYRSKQNLQRRGNYRNILRDGRVSLPTIVYFEPTMRCNLRCKMCYINFDTLARDEELSLHQIKRMFDQMPASFSHVVITGGEPLLKEGIEELFAYFEKRRITVTLLSNLINTQILERVLKSKAITVINTSIDGPEFLHNKIRGSNKAYDGIRAGIELVKATPAKDVLLPVCVISEYNLPYLKEVVQLIKDMGLNSLIFELERRYDNKVLTQSAEIIKVPLEDFRVRQSESAKPAYSFEDLKYNLQEVVKYAKRLKVKLNFLPIDLPKYLEGYYFRRIRREYRLFCDALLSARMDSYGNLYPCMVVQKRLGNLLDRDFNDVWNSKEFSEYRLTLLRNNLLPICETCYSCKKVSRL